MLSQEAREIPFPVPLCRTEKTKIVLLPIRPLSYHFPLPIRTLILIPTLATYSDQWR